MAFNAPTSLGQNIGVNSSVLQGIANPPMIDFEKRMSELENAKIQRQKWLQDIALAPLEAQRKQEEFQMEKDKIARLNDLMTGMRGLPLDQQAQAMINSGDPDMISRGINLLNAAKAPASTNINLNVDTKGVEEWQKEIGGKKFSELYDAAQSAESDIASIDYAIDTLKSDPQALTGDFANVRGKVSSILTDLGMGDKVTELGLPNATDFQQLNRVMNKAVIEEAKTKALGSGTGVSNRDLSLYKDVAGKITDTPEAIMFNLRYRRNIDKLTQYKDEIVAGEFESSGNTIKSLRKYDKVKAGAPVMKVLTKDGKKTPIMFSEFYENIKAQRGGNYTLEEAFKDFKGLK